MIKFDQHGYLADKEGRYANLHLQNVIHGYAVKDRPEEGALLVFTEEGRSGLHIMRIYQYKGNTEVEWLNKDSDKDVLANVMIALLKGNIYG